MIAITLALSLLTLISGQDEPRLEIVAPPSQFSTCGDHVYIIGKTNAPIIEIQLNEKKYDEIIVKDSIFHSYVKFGYGFNVIEITPVYSGSVRAKTEHIHILSAPNIMRKYEKYFDEYIFHEENPKTECISCHKFDSDSQQPVDNDRFCFECHKEIDQNFKSHIPDNEKACVICHKLSNDLTLVTTGTVTDTNPCFFCHKEKMGLFTQDYVHGPVAGGSCTICHTPHGSEFENSLIYPVEVLCSTCHTNMDDARTKQIQHKPFLKGKCGQCHDPHSTNHKWVLVKNSQEICVPCHMPDGELKYHNHPFNVKPKRRLLSPLELTDSGQLECLSCHNPHATETKHLLRTSQGHSCLGCHPDR